MWKNSVVPVPRVDREGLILDDERPVVIPYPELVGSTARWKDLNFLEQQFGDTPVTVMASPTKVFKYYDEQKNRGKYKYELTAKRTSMTFAEFKQKLLTNNKLETNTNNNNNNTNTLVQNNTTDTTDNNTDSSTNTTSKTYHYMQHPFGGLTPKNLDIFGVKQDLMDDTKKFEWDWLNTQVRSHPHIFDQVHPVLGFMLWVGDGGCVTPTHFDQQHVFLTQVKGFKKILLVSPSEFSKMYPYPMRHVYDRQAQIDIFAPDLKRFPSFADVEIHEAVIGPGDVLFLPAFWWHYVESTSSSEEDDITISVRFSCYRAEKKGNNWPNKILAMRAVERVVAEILGESQATHFFSTVFGVNESEQITPEKKKGGGKKPKVRTWNRSQLLEEVKKCLDEAGITEDAEEFLRVMVQGRFDFDDHKAT